MTDFIAEEYDSSFRITIKGPHHSTFPCRLPTAAPSLRMEQDSHDTLASEII